MYLIIFIIHISFWHYLQLGIHYYMFLRAFLSYCMISLKSYSRQERFHPVTSTRISRLLKYIQTGLGRKNWRGGFSLLGSEQNNQILYYDWQVHRQNQPPHQRGGVFFKYLEKLKEACYYKLRTEKQYRQYIKRGFLQSPLARYKEQSL